jgi:hypothetical protein
MPVHRAGRYLYITSGMYCHEVDDDVVLHFFIVHVRPHIMDETIVVLHISCDAELLEEFCIGGYHTHAHTENS